LIASSHRLKGSGGAFGFPELTELSSRILAQARDENDDGLAALIQALNQRCDELTKKAS
jgi:hypothetical protein